jgi:hypothetical protein
VPTSATTSGSRGAPHAGHTIGLGVGLGLGIPLCAVLCLGARVRRRRAAARARGPVWTRRSNSVRRAPAQASEDDDVSEEMIELARAVVIPFPSDASASPSPVASFRDSKVARSPGPASPALLPPADADSSTPRILSWGGRAPPEKSTSAAPPPPTRALSGVSTTELVQELNERLQTADADGGAASEQPPVYEERTGIGQPGPVPTQHAAGREVAERKKL